MTSPRAIITPLLALSLFGACSDDGSSGETNPSSSSDSSETAGSTAATDSAASTDSSDTSELPEPALPETDPCESGEEALLFGSPTANTGLGSDQCQPSCSCSGGEWTPPSYDEDFISWLEGRTELDQPALLTEDPYVATPELTPDEDSVCAVMRGREGYTTNTFPDEQSAVEAGGWITHRGACGQCSSLANLAVYMRMPDLTAPVRQCGLDGIIDGEEANIECLMEIGFDRPCAQIWYYNTNHTREQCLDVCLAELENPNHQEDGSLNPCIQCDEDESGPVFKAVSGRTRRNSGLPSALCRPCDSIYRVTHDYGYTAASN